MTTSLSIGHEYMTTAELQVTSAPKFPTPKHPPTGQIVTLPAGTIVEYATWKDEISLVFYTVVNCGDLVARFRFVLSDEVAHRVLKQT